MQILFINQHIFLSTYFFKNVVDKNIQALLKIIYTNIQT